MTLASSINRVSYTGNATTASYSYTFRIFSEDDLKLIIKNASDVETLLVKTTDYTVSGVGDDGGGTISLVNASQAWLDGSGFLDTGFSLTIRRVVSIVQSTDIRNQGDFFPETHEDTFDQLTMIDQQQQDEIDRSVKLPDTVSPSDFDAELPASIVGQVSVSIATNPTGDGFVVGPTVDDISNAQTYANAADASAVSAAADLVLTNADVVLTNADVVLTNADVVSTNANVVQTNADKIASAASAAAALVSENNAETAETNAELAETNAAASEAAAAISATAASDSYDDTVALLAGSFSGKETIADSQTATNLTITIDETTHTYAIFEYFVTRGSSVQYGELLILDESPFSIHEKTKIGDAGVTFAITEAAGIGTLNYSSTADTAGSIRYKYLRFEIGA